MTAFPVVRELLSWMVPKRRKMSDVLARWERTRRFEFLDLWYTENDLDRHFRELFLAGIDHRSTVSMEYRNYDDEGDTMTTTLVRPTPQPINIGPVAAAAFPAYVDLAAKTGFDPAALTVQRMRHFLHLEKLPIYDYAAVHFYLRKLAGDNKHYVWCPLRAKDRIMVSRNWVTDGACRNETPTYQKLVPDHALAKVALIEDEPTLRDKVKFYVSEIIANPDPFLMVRPIQEVMREDWEQQCLVIDVWDEPGFTSK